MQFNWKLRPPVGSFRLTIRNVNYITMKDYEKYKERFRLTIRNVNYTESKRKNVT